MINAILLVIITVFRTLRASLSPSPSPNPNPNSNPTHTANSSITVPPVGVFLIKGCGADVLINICLTILGYFPGHIHAFYLEYQYYHRKDQAAQQGMYNSAPAPGEYSSGGGAAPADGYGTMGGQQRY